MQRHRQRNNRNLHRFLHLQTLKYQGHRIVGGVHGGNSSGVSQGTEGTPSINKPSQQRSSGFGSSGHGGFDANGTFCFRPKPIHPKSTSREIERIYPCST
eukprot:2811889-Amphidinium_carterae.1